jgi:hypothetical protein
MIEEKSAASEPLWNAEFNKRRFERIFDYPESRLTRHRFP